MPAAEHPLHGRRARALQRVSLPPSSFPSSLAGCAPRGDEAATAFPKARDGCAGFTRNFPVAAPIPGNLGKRSRAFCLHTGPGGSASPSCRDVPAIRPLRAGAGCCITAARKTLF